MAEVPKTVKLVHSPQLHTQNSSEPSSDLPTGAEYSEKMKSYSF